MASFTLEKRKTSKGVLRYRCVVRLKKGNEVVYRESRTFGKKPTQKHGGQRLYPNSKRMAYQANPRKSLFEN